MLSAPSNQVKVMCTLTMCEDFLCRGEGHGAEETGDLADLCLVLTFLPVLALLRVLHKLLCR